MVNSMAAHLVQQNGKCTTCSEETNEGDILECYECKSYFHAICDAATPFASRSFIGNFKKLKTCNIVFICDECKTRKENNEASNLKDQILSLTDTVKNLVSEFKLFKEEKSAQNVGQTKADITENGWNDSTWSNEARTKKMTSALCIKSKGVNVNIDKVKEIAVDNNIQVTNTVVQENGDVYVNLPTKENRDKLTHLLGDEAFNGNEVVSMKSRLPTLSVNSINEFTTKEDFVEKVKQQNPRIKEEINKGSIFSIVYVKKPPDLEVENGKKCYQIVARVSEEIRKVIKMNNNKIYMDLIAHHVADRFYIIIVKNLDIMKKTARIMNNQCCGYCS